MRKKIVASLMTLAIALLVGMNKVEAIYNGSDGNLSSGSGVGCIDASTRTYNGLKGQFCQNGNEEFKAIKVRLVYYENGVESQAAPNPVYIINNRNYVTNTIGGVVLLDSEIGITITKNGCKKGYSYGCDFSSADMEKWFLKEPGNNMDLILIKMGILNGRAGLTKTTEKNIGFNKTGYRIIIEPILSGYINKVFDFYTPKQILNHNGATNNSGGTGTKAQACLLYTNDDDIGIYAASTNGRTQGLRANSLFPGSTYKCDNGATELLGGGYNNNPTVVKNMGRRDQGYGYNIINFEPVIKTCYKSTIKTVGGKLDCKNTNKQNEVTYAETYESTDCKNLTEDERKDNQYGKLTRTVNANCKIYCRETVEAKFPGNIAPAMKVGTHFVWPEIGTTINNVNKLDIKGTQICTKELSSGASSAETNACNNYTNGKSADAIANDLYSNFKTTATLTYNGKDYEGDITLQQHSEKTGYSVSGNTIAITRERQLKLKDNTYRYVDRETGKAQSQASSKTLDLGYANLPISTNEIIADSQNKIKQHQLQIKDIVLGVGGKFKAEAAKSNYICKYTVTKSPQGPCVCPPGTKNAGQNLWCYLSDPNNDLNCVEAQEKYCDLDPSEFKDEETCPPVGKYCPDMPWISLEPCVSAGNSYESCKNKYCTGLCQPGEPCYSCPGDGPNSPPMDITSCVEIKLAQGYTLDEARHVCAAIICHGGNRIIYRTINLENPFPSKKLNGSTNAFNLNGTRKDGRIPGYNWNSKTIVDTKILNNREVTAGKVYSKDPMYVITLDRTTMLKVREYNKAQKNKYADFTLDCKENGGACISDKFLRKTISIETGTCKNATNKEAFKACQNAGVVR
jgi:hypothetical protein